MMMADNQVVGTSVFDEYPTYEEWYAPFAKLEGKAAKEFDMMVLMEPHFAHLPVWAAGNVYLDPGFQNELGRVSRIYRRRRAFGSDAEIVAYS